MYTKKDRPVNIGPAPTSDLTLQKNVVIVAGEASGDAHGARLVKQLKQLKPNIKFRGMGGSKLRQAGVEVLTDISQLAFIGIVDILRNYPMLKRELNALKKNLSDNPPDLLILIDYQEFNQRLGAFAKSIGIKVLFYIGPQVWAWRANRVYKMAKVTDHMAVIFPFEKAFYEKAEVAVTFTGHPLLDDVFINKSKQQARQLLSLKETTTVGLFPGSRRSEIKHILPVLLESAKQLNHQKPELQFVLPLASTLTEQDLAPFKNQLNNLSVQCINNHVEDTFYDVIQSCDLILSASGTATLEITLLEVPYIIIYKISALNYFILSKLVKIKHIGIVNIIAKKEVVKEFVQHHAQANSITQEALKLLNNKQYYQEMIDAFRQVRAKLSTKKANNIAKLALSMLKTNKTI